MIIWEYDNKKSQEETGISKLGTDTLQGLLIITYIMNIMQLTRIGVAFVFTSNVDYKGISLSITG